MATLADLMTMYGGSGNRAGMTTNDMTMGDGSFNPQADELLSLAKQYDPNANLNGGQLTFDRTKLPQPTAKQLGGLDRFNQGDKGGNFWNAYSLVRDGKGDGGAEIKDPSQVIHDANYGDYVARTNLKVAPGDTQTGIMGNLEKYMPAVVAAVMSAGMGAAAGPLIGGLMSGTLGPGGIGNKLAMGEPVDWGKTALNMGVSAAGSLIPGMTSGMPGGANLKDIMPWINVGRGVYGASKGNVGSGISGAMTLGKLLQAGGMG